MNPCQPSAQQLEDWKQAHPIACKNAQHKKKGKCGECGMCKKCPVPEWCVNGDHIGNNKDREKTKKPTEKRTREANGGERTAKRVAQNNLASGSAANNKADMSIDAEEFTDELMAATVEASQTRKVQNPGQLFDALGITAALVRKVDAVGLVENSTSFRELSRALEQVIEVSLKLCLDGDPAAMRKSVVARLTKRIDSAEAISLAERNESNRALSGVVENLAVCGSSATRQVAMSALCMSIPFKELKERLAGVGYGEQRQRAVRAADKCMIFSLVATRLCCVHRAGLPCSKKPIQMAGLQSFRRVGL
jgi:hypothetical protein